MAYMAVACGSPRECVGKQQTPPDKTVTRITELDPKAIQIAQPTDSPKLVQFDNLEDLGVGANAKK